MRVGLLMALGLSLVIPTGAGTAQTPTSAAALTWRPCLPTLTAATPAATATAAAGLQCATLLVPLDYADPTGAQITIGLNRLPARDPAHRIGNLIFNPGGPGGAASPLVAREASGVRIFTPAVRDHFDLIGLDPRGTGTSTPVRCDPNVWNEPVALFPNDAAGFANLRAHTQAVGESCRRLTGPLLGHLDTVSAARDLERVRLALGGEPLNYLGLSYGTQLGATYAQLFPGHIRVLALDGALDHAQRPLAMLDDEAHAYETELTRFAAWCAATASCALHGQDVLAGYDALVAAANVAPIPAPRCQAAGACRAAATGDDIRFAVQNYLLFKEPTPAFGLPGWAGLATALATAQAGDASAFAPPLARSETDALYAGLAIACVDWQTDIATYDDLAAYETFGRVIAPHTRGATQTWSIVTGCLGWPAPVANPPGLWQVQGTPPILIVNATYDPSTAYVWAQLMRQQLAGSVLLTRIGDGHTSYLLPGASQTREAIDHYLLTGQTPPPNMVVTS